MPSRAETYHVFLKTIACLMLKSLRLRPPRQTYLNPDQHRHLRGPPELVQRLSCWMKAKGSPGWNCLRLCPSHIRCSPGLHSWSLVYWTVDAIIPTLFLYFLLICYPYILLRFLMFFYSCNDYNLSVYCTEFDTCTTKDECFFQLPGQNLSSGSDAQFVSKDNSADATG